jgi:hypothetical protein
MSEGQHQPLALGGLGHRARLRQRNGRRLLAQHMLAGL